MNNLSNFANFGELKKNWGGSGGGGAKRKSAPRAPKILATPLVANAYGSRLFLCALLK